MSGIIVCNMGRFEEFKSDKATAESGAADTYTGRQGAPGDPLAYAEQEFYSRHMRHMNFAERDALLARERVAAETRADNERAMKALEEARKARIDALESSAVLPLAQELASVAGTHVRVSGQDYTKVIPVKKLPGGSTDTSGREHFGLIRLEGNVDGSVNVGSQRLDKAEASDPDIAAAALGRAYRHEEIPTIPTVKPPFVSSGLYHPPSLLRRALKRLSRPSYPTDWRVNGESPGQ